MAINDGIGEPYVARIADTAERAGRKIDVHDQIVEDFGADMAGLRFHLLHQPGALDGVGEAGVIFHIGGDHQLAAGLQAGHQHRGQAGARGIDGGRIAGGAGADNKNAGAVDGGHGEAGYRCLKTSRQYRVAWRR